MPRHSKRRAKRDPYASVTVFSAALTGRPEVWRTIAIRSDQTLDDLHAILFTAFDRFDEHLYSFRLQPLYARRGDNIHEGNIEFTSPVMIEEAEALGSHEVRDASRTVIGMLGLEPGDKLHYLFDFGDSWWHDLTVEECGLPPQPGRRYPLILEKRGVSPVQYPPVEEET